MRKQSTRIPKIRLHKASGQGVVWLNGRENYLGPFGSYDAQLKYDALLLEWRQAGCRPNNGPDQRLTVLELTVEYMDRHVVGYYQKQGQETCMVDQFRYSLRDLNRLYGTIAAEDFGPRRLKAVQEHLISKQLAVGTINSSTCY
jgi:hypothetical protein